jgi:RNA polymerase sigma-70 factor (ECF subfamily)
VHLYSHAVYRFIYSNLKDSDDAANIVQNAFEVLWLNHERVDFNKAKSYLFTVSYRDRIDFIRKHKRKMPLEEKHENVLADTRYYSDAGYISLPIMI